MKILIAVSILCLPGLIARAQENTTLDKITEFPARFFSVIEKKTAKLEARLEKQAAKYLQRLARRENKIRRKLSAIDSTASQNLFGNSEAQYAQLNQSIRSTDSSAPGATGEYVAYVDS